MIWPFPFTRDGRQTLVYIVFAGCGPALTVATLWAMQVIHDWTGASDAARLDKFAELAVLIGVALLIVTVALACFVSIRAIKVGRDGIEATSNNEGAAICDGDSVTVLKEQPDA